MRRLAPFTAALVLALAACASPGEGGGVTTTVSQVGTTATSGPATPTTGPAASTTTPAPEETGTTSGREMAPDFTLDLGEGGTYTLSEADKPVYLVFWAEW